jgi:hypothetical protein
VLVVVVGSVEVGATVVGVVVELFFALLEHAASPTTTTATNGRMRRMGGQDKTPGHAGGARRCEAVRMSDPPWA